MTHITDEGLANLRGLVHLKSLDLSRTRVTNAGISRLRGLVHLTELRSFESGITMDPEHAILEINKR